MDLCINWNFVILCNIGVNVELFYAIMGKENLRKEGLNGTNWKVLDLIGWLWEVGETNGQLSLKLLNIFDFIDIL